MDTLNRFISEQCDVAPSARCKAADFLAAFRAYAGDEAKQWPRHRIIQALTGRFSFGVVRNGLRIGGVGLPTVGWHAREGELVLG